MVFPPTHPFVGHSSARAMAESGAPAAAEGGEPGRKGRGVQFSVPLLSGDEEKVRVRECGVRGGGRGGQGGAGRGGREALRRESS